MKKLLIIGGTGFVGSHIVKHFSNKQITVSTGRDFDIRNIDKIKELIDCEQPDNIINLASITTIKESIEKPKETYEISFGGTHNILSVLEKTKFNGCFLYVSSSEVYGLIRSEDLPVNESKLTKPLSPYAVSKVATEALCFQLSQQSNFKIIMARPFNHIGPGQSDRFSVSYFAKQIMKIKLGLISPQLKVGDIDTARDFTDVRDIVCAYEKLIEFGENGEIYNVCSGREVSIRSLIESMSELLNIKVEIVKEEDRFRYNDQRRVCGNNKKIINTTGWTTTYVLDQTLQDILAEWNCRIILNKF
jgi:GDP-4-dehydro-6-deoxy-D-mannose reductase